MTRNAWLSWKRRARHFWPGALSSLLGLVLLTFGAARAEEMYRISLQQAVGIALEKSTSIEQALSRVASSRISVGQAKLDLYPDLTASVSGNKQYIWSNTLRDSAGDYESSGSVSGRISSSLTLFDGLGTVNSVRSARLELSVGEAAYQRTRQAVVFTVVSDYLTVLEKGDLVKSQQDNLEAQRQRLALIEEFYRAGKRSIADVLQQQAAVAQAELQVLSAERDESLSKLQLTADMGISPTVDYSVAPVDSATENRYLIDSTKDAILRTALGLRPDVSAQRKKISAASARVAVARSGWWPSLSLSAGASSSDTDRDGWADLLRQISEDNLNFSAGVSLSIPVFDRFRTSTAVRQAKLSLSAEEIALGDLERKVALEVENALLNYETARKRQDVAKAQLDYASEALRAITARYEVGSSTLVEVTASNAQFVSARNDAVQASYQLLLSRVAVSYYGGNVGEMAGLLGFSLEGGSGE